MRTAAITLALVTLFPILGFVCCFSLVMLLVGGIDAYLKDGYDLKNLAVAGWSLAGIVGLLSAAETTLHFINHPDQRFGSWQARRLVLALVMGCCAYIGIAFIDLGAFFLILVVSPVLVLALGLLSMITLRQFDVV